MLKRYKLHNKTQHFVSTYSFTFSKIKISGLIKVNLRSTINKIQKTLKQLQPGVVALVRQKQADLYEINVNLVSRAGPRPGRLQKKKRTSLKKKSTAKLLLLNTTSIHHWRQQGRKNLAMSLAFEWPRFRYTETHHRLGQTWAWTIILTIREPWVVLPSQNSLVHSILGNGIKMNCLFIVSPEYHLICQVCPQCALEVSPGSYSSDQFPVSC